MKNLLLALLFSLSFIACSDEVSVPVQSKIVVGSSLAPLTLNDQFEKSHTVSADTQKIIFAFSKDMGHMSNEFFAKQDADYLAKHNAVFIADVSGAPSLIRSMFIMPGLKDFKHTVLVIEDKNVAASYRIDTHKEKIMVLDVKDMVIEKINYVSDEASLEKAL